MMEKKQAKPGPVAAKKTPQKPTPKKRRLLLKFFLVFFLIAGVALAGLYQRWFPLPAEMDAQIDPYRVQLASLIDGAENLIKKAEPLLEKIGIASKPAEQTPTTNPQTNFPLVDLGKEDKQPTTVTGPATTTPGAPAIASASPLQPAGAAKPPASGKLDPETSKVYGKLSKLYGAMKAEEAVAVFNNLEDEQVVMILSRMEEEAAAKILASLEPKRAARLTQAMIKRK